LWGHHDDATVGGRRETQQSELPTRLCVVGKDCGISFTKLKNLFGGMNASSTMHLRTYRKTVEKVHKASMAAARDVMQEVATAMRGAQVSKDGEDHVNNADDLLGVCVNYDASTVRGCNLGPKEDAEGYQAWMESHKGVCQKNSGGSSNAVDVAAAGVIFSRSLKLHKLQYVTMLIFTRDIAKELVPIYNRLSDQSLFQKCCRMKTQNRNESFNTLIWKRCPKTEFVARAVLEYNLGPKGFERILKTMGMCPGSHYEERTRKATQQKILKAKMKSLDTSKTAQKRRKLEAIANEQKRIKEGGPTCGAGES
ncbi:hypothetical protein ISCGN_028877, partial [Ixodes scapularis]